MPATAPTKQKPTQAKSAFQSQSAPSRRPRNTKGFFFPPNFSSKQGGRNAAVVVVVVKMLVGRRPATPWPCVSAGSGTQPGASRWCQRRLLGLRVTVLVANMNHERPCGATIPNTTPRLIPPPDESDICHANAMGAKRVGPSLITIKIATDFTWNSSESIFVCVCDICCQYHTFR